MKKLMGLFVIVLVLTGCSWDKSDVSDGLKLRQLLQSEDRYVFTAEITADYGDRIYTFTMDCGTDGTGDVDFSIVHPESIQGISGSITQTGGRLVFDDTVLLFDSLTQGQVTPVIGPWLMIKAIQGGYIQAVSEQNGKEELVIDDTFGTEKFRMLLELGEEGFPCGCEIYWQNRRMLTIKISNFQKE